MLVDLTPQRKLASGPGPGPPRIGPLGSGGRHHHHPNKNSQSPGGPCLPGHGQERPGPCGSGLAGPGHTTPGGFSGPGGVFPGQVGGPWNRRKSLDGGGEGRAGAGQFRPGRGRKVPRGEVAWAMERPAAFPIYKTDRVLVGPEGGLKIHCVCPVFLRAISKARLKGNSRPVPGRRAAGPFRPVGRPFCPEWRGRAGFQPPSGSALASLRRKLDHP